MGWSGLLQALGHLPERHLAALSWFETHAEQETSWPKPLPDGTLLAARAKGIYKPAWSKYALSIRSTLAGPYPDRDIEWTDGRTWRLQYFQEDLEPGRRDSQFTNVGLLECWKDVVPVGVLVQTSGRPNPSYRVQGLGLVTGWDQGYFTVQGGGEGYGIVKRSNDCNDEAENQHTPRSAAGRADDVAGQFDPASLEDRRRETLRLVVTREGQQGFRGAMLKAYGGRCAITECDAECALEAAHIVPYRGPVTNHPSNGLLLRADLHNLFDLGQLAIDPKSYAVLLSPRIATTSYGPELSERILKDPTDPELGPSRLALNQHRVWSGL